MACACGARHSSARSNAGPGRACGTGQPSPVCSPSAARPPWQRSRPCTRQHGHCRAAGSGTGSLQKPRLQPHVPQPALPRTSHGCDRSLSHHWSLPIVTQASRHQDGHAAACTACTGPSQAPRDARACAASHSVCSVSGRRRPCRRVGLVSFTDPNNAALGISMYRDYDGWGSPGLQLSLRQPGFGGGAKRPFPSSGASRHRSPSEPPRMWSRPQGSGGLGASTAPRRPGCSGSAGPLGPRGCATCAAVPCCTGHLLSADGGSSSVLHASQKEPSQHLPQPARGASAPAQIQCQVRAATQLRQTGDPLSSTCCAVRTCITQRDSGERPQHTPSGELPAPLCCPHRQLAAARAGPLQT